MSQSLEWFTDRIGKRVYRKKGRCNCYFCSKAPNEGVEIQDIEKAKYLQKMAEEMRLKYYDEPIVR